MPKLLVEPHYLGSLEYFVLLLTFDEVVLEVAQHFTKQTYKNRCYFVTSQGSAALSVPVRYGNRTPLRDVKIDHSQSWKRDHWGAFCSAYGKAPFYEHYEDGFRKVWEKRHTFLLDLDLEMMTLCLQNIHCDMRISLTEKYEKLPEKTIYDFREIIDLKKPFTERKIYLPFPYIQTFGNKFVPNPSIVDLLMCEGNRAAEVLKRSTFAADEQM